MSRIDMRPHTKAQALNMHLCEAAPQTSPLLPLPGFSPTADNIRTRPLQDVASATSSSYFPAGQSVVGDATPQAEVHWLVCSQTAEQMRSKPTRGATLQPDKKLSVLRHAWYACTFARSFALLILILPDLAI